MEWLRDTSGRYRAASLWALTLAAAACVSDDRPAIIEPELPVDSTCSGAYCNRSLLDVLRKDAFYKKVLVSLEMPFISSAKVDDRALLAAAVVVNSMLLFRPDIRQAMLDRGAYVAVMAEAEVTTDIPEHAYLKNDPEVDWDTRARGLGATVSNPITTVGEENLLCLAGDVYSGESILVHEFAHSMHNLGIVFVDPGFQAELEETYAAAQAEGLWTDTYADTNPAEYWAEGVQSWFDANQQPQPGIHNSVNTRAELLEHDPRLYELISLYLPASDWSPACPTG